MKSRMELQDEDYSPFSTPKKLELYVQIDVIKNEMQLQRKKNMYHNHYAYDCVHRNGKTYKIANYYSYS